MGTGDLPLSLSLSLSLGKAPAAATYLSSVSKRDRINKLSILAHSISAALSHFVPQFPDPFLSFSSLRVAWPLLQDISYHHQCCCMVFGIYKIFQNLETRQSVLVLLKNQNQRTSQGQAYLNPIKEHAKVTLIWIPSKNTPRSRLFESHQRTHQGHTYLNPIKEHTKVTLIWNPSKNHERTGSPGYLKPH